MDLRSLNKQVEQGLKNNTIVKVGTFHLGSPDLGTALRETAIDASGETSFILVHKPGEASASRYDVYRTIN